MPRIAPLQPPYPPDVQGHFDQIMPPGAEPLLLFRTLATQERAWRKFRAGSLLDRGPLSLRDREIVIDRTCALTGCAYEWGVHVAAFAARARLTDEQVRSTATGGPDDPCWTEAERALLRAVDALHARATLDEPTWTALRLHYDEAQSLEIMLLAGFYRTVAYLANGLALPSEPGTPPLPTAA